MNDPNGHQIVESSDRNWSLLPPGSYVWDSTNIAGSRKDGPTVVLADGNESYYLKSTSLRVISIRTDGEIDNENHRIDPNTGKVDFNHA